MYPLTVNVRCYFYFLKTFGGLVSAQLGRKARTGRTTKGYSVVLPVRENPGQNYHISQISAISLAVFVTFS